MRRYAQESALRERRRKCDRAITGYPKEVGLYHKRKPVAGMCGNPKCCICHYEKVHDIKSRKEQLADLRFREQL